VSWRDDLPPVRGRLLIDAPLRPFTWFRVGGPAEVLFIPADEADLADFLQAVSVEVPRTVLGVGSNLIVRDGGIEGLVIRLAGRAFGEIRADKAAGRVTAGAGALDSAVARAAAEAGIGGLEFLAGIPGTVGGALTMNAGCYGSETKDVLVRGEGVDAGGNARALDLADFGFTYRANAVPPGMVWLRGVFQGQADDPAAVRARIAEITSRRETSQPIREKTGGSTFKNPLGHSAWKLVDEAGWRGREIGGAMMSPLHANFMINTGAAQAADLEALGEAVRADVKVKSGIALDWEIKRIGRAASAESR
jgi:UDP-N-acetylmuramate dehydrogenase